MLSNIFLGLSLVGAEWVLYLLILLSLLSIGLIIERALFYKQASRNQSEYRTRIRKSVADKNWNQAIQASKEWMNSRPTKTPDIESLMSLTLLEAGKSTPEVLTELAEDTVSRARLLWEKNLFILATIGNNAPFIGLFGTVLGIIKAFHDLSQQTGGVQTVTSGISEALVATAIGLLVAIPAVIAFNIFQRRVRTAITEAEALKSFIIAKLSQ
jgi:biopolymer transport protein ExbB